MNDTIRAAHACGKLHDRIALWDKTGIEWLWGNLEKKFVAAKTGKAASRLVHLMSNLDDIQELGGRTLSPLSTVLEWRKGEWFRWTLADGKPIEFRRLNPQPEVPVL